MRTPCTFPFDPPPPPGYFIVCSSSGNGFVKTKTKTIFRSLAIYIQTWNTLQRSNFHWGSVTISYCRAEKSIRKKERKAFGQYLDIQCFHLPSIKPRVVNILVLVLCLSGISFSLIAAQMQAHAQESACTHTVCLCQRPGPFHGEIRIIVLPLVLRH